MSSFSFERSAWTTGVTIVASMLPGFAAAHTGHAEPVGFWHGFMHPLGGLDHLLAMVTVGVLGVVIGGRAVWLAPLAFLGMMVVGGLIGASGVDVPFIEIGIIGSVLILGAMLIPQLRPSTSIAIGIVGLLAIFHGYAHGSEMPVDAKGVEYGTGFLVATLALHGAGIALALIASRLRLGFKPFSAA